MESRRISTFSVKSMSSEYKGGITKEWTDVVKNHKSRIGNGAEEVSQGTGDP